MREGALICALAAVGCSAARAEQPSKSKVDPKADELLRKMSKQLASTQSFQVDADHVLEVVTKDEEMLQFVARSRVAVQRPNQMRSDRIGRVADMTFYYDGKQISLVGKRTGLYATSPAPQSLDAALDFARDELNLDAPAADLLYSDAYAGLMEEVQSGTYVGNEPVGERMCHHLAFRSSETDWQIWIEDGPRALPCRYVIRSKRIKGTPTFQVELSNWKIAPRFEAKHFTFKPPVGGTQIEFVSRAPTNGKG
jgi:hypothetical protein